MTLGIILLVLMAVLIYFGFAQRVLDRMYLTDKQALLFIGLMIAGGFIDIPITTAPEISINVGGALLPVALAIYILSKADSGRDWLKTIFSVIVTGGVIYSLTKIYQFEEGHTLLDPSYIFAIVAGTTAYLTSRSRRNAFISGTLGFILYDLIHVWRITFGGVPGQANIGGAGALDTIVTSGLIAVLLAEVIGESRESLQGGTAHKRENQAEKQGDKNLEVEKELDDVEYADFMEDGIEEGQEETSAEQDKINKEDDQKRGERE